MNILLSTLMMISQSHTTTNLMILISVLKTAYPGGRMVLQFVATGTNILTWPELSDPST